MCGVCVSGCVTWQIIRFFGGKPGARKLLVKVAVYSGDNYQGDKLLYFLAHHC